MLREFGWEDEADRLRIVLLSWLTEPIPFAEFRSETLDRLATDWTIDGFWGTDISDLIGLVAADLETLRSMTSPLRQAVADELEAALDSGAKLRVYCHRNATIAFTSIPAWSVGIESGTFGFLHTPRDYRHADPFDILIKVGPLRSRGCGALPAAVLNAPRFHTLLQFTWSGLPDDPDFGADPLLKATGEKVPRQDGGKANGKQRGGVTWSRRTVRAAIDPADEALEDSADELMLFSTAPHDRESRSAILLQVGEDEAVLYPPGTEVLAMRSNPPSGRAVECVRAATLNEGDFLVWAEVGDSAPDEARATEGSLSTQWKARLVEELATRPTDLEDRLRSAGLALRNLGAALQLWARPASSVIHAPRQPRHFEMLVRVLGIEDDQVNFPRPSNVAWWRLAWAEIAASRGQAVQMGMQEQEAIRGRLLGVLNGASDQLAQRTAERATFTVPLSEEELSGTVTFRRIQAVEAGYLAPETMLRVLLPLSQAYEWRA